MVFSKACIFEGVQVALPCLEVDRRTSLHTVFPGSNNTVYNDTLEYKPHSLRNFRAASRITSRPLDNAPRSSGTT